MQMPKATKYLGFSWEWLPLFAEKTKQSYGLGDYLAAEQYCSAGFSSLPPILEVPEDIYAWAVSDQEISTALSLRPNPIATLSWMTALCEAGKLAGKLPKEQVVLITRYDIWWPDSALQDLFEIANSLDSVVMTPMRPVKHQVIRHENKNIGLPVDHWIIGRAGDLACLGGITTWLEARTPAPGDVPFVNEFLLGHFLAEVCPSVNREVLTPYLLWRVYEGQVFESLSRWDNFRQICYEKHKLRVGAAKWYWRALRF
jgi:hypothetical protein